MARPAKFDAVPQISLTLVHDLNNDLGIIIAECDLLEKSLDENSGALRHLKMIKVSARRIATRISDRS